jgi:WD40 repeat protein/nucleoside phosphorylase
MSTPIIPFIPPGLPPEEADIVLVTATDIEYQMVVAVWRGMFHEDAPPQLAQSGYTDLGTIRGNHVLLTQQAQMGALGDGAAYPTVEDAILDWAPRAVVMVGICYGLKGQIGDVLVAETVRYVDQRKLDTDTTTGALRIVPRGARLQVDTALLMPFKRAIQSWPEAEQVAGRQPTDVRTGLLLSGAALINNRDYRDEAASFEPEARGGEMEAEGVAGAASKYDMPWILVKAICDYADGEKDKGKDEFQRLAATNAARFVLYALSQGKLTIRKPAALLRWHPRAYDVADLESPYLHLRSYTNSADDQAKFAGRGQIIDQMVTRIVNPDQPRTRYFITGASGSGKSSLMQAGLLPALQRHYEQGSSHTLAALETAVITPGDLPMSRFARAIGLVPTPGEVPSIEAVLVQLRACTADHRVLILAFDQFEELFTQADKAQCKALLDLLAALPPFAELPLHILIAMREVFVPALAEQPRLQQEASEPPLFRRMGQSELREAITRPLRARYPLKRLDPALLDRLVTDALDEDSYLPLLQVTLDTIWSGKHSLALGTSGYSGLADAINSHAEQVYVRCWRAADRIGADRSEGERRLIIDLLLDMVMVGEERETRRYARVPRSLVALTQGNQAMIDLLHELTDARLLVSRRGEDGAETISIIHETVLFRWTRLSDAIEGQRTRLRRRARFEEQLSLWRADQTSLLEGRQLAEAEEMERSGDIALRNDQARAFLRASQERRRKQEREYADRLRLRQNLAWLAAVIALVFAIAASVFGLRAQENERIAVAAVATSEADAARSDSQRLALLSQDIRDPYTAFLVAAASVQRDSNPSAFRALRRELARIRQGWIPLSRHTSDVTTAVFSPNGQQVVTASRDGTAKVWDVASGVLLHSLEGHTDTVLTAVFSPNGQQVVTASSDNTAKVWDVASGALLHSLEGHTSDVTTATFSPNGQQVVTASGDSTAKVWDVVSGALLHSLEGHTAIVYTAAFSPNGQQVVTASGDSTAKVWDVASGALLHSLEDGAYTVNTAMFSPNGQQVVTTNLFGRTAKVWDAASGALLHSLEGHTSDVTTAVFSPNGQQVVTASSDNTAKVWDVASGVLIHSLEGHTDTVYTAAFSPNGQQVVTASQDGTAKVWDVASGVLLHSLEGHTTGVSTAAFSPNGQQVVTASSDNTAKVWDVVSGALLHSLEGHTAIVYTAAFSPNGQQVVTTSGDSTAKVWDVASGALLHSLDGHTAIVYTATFSPNGQQAVTASQDGTAKVWDVASGTLLRSLEGGAYIIYTAIFSPNGQQVVTTSQDGSAKVWDVASGVLLHSLEGHTAIVSTAAFSPNGQQVVTASSDNTAKVWDVASGALLHSLEGHTDTVNTATFSPNGQQVVTASQDGSAKVYPLEESDLLATASCAFYRPLSADEIALYQIKTPFTADPKIQCPYRLPIR